MNFSYRLKANCTFISSCNHCYWIEAKIKHKIYAILHQDSSFNTKFVRTDESYLLLLVDIK